MPHPDEGLIHAWLDGELDAAESARVEALVARDPQWAAAAADARGLIAASSRIVGALDGLSANVAPRTRTRSGLRYGWLSGLAALLLVVASATTVLRRKPPELGQSNATNSAPAVAKALPVQPAPQSAAAGLQSSPKDRKAAVAPRNEPSRPVGTVSSSLSKRPDESKRVGEPRAAGSLADRDVTERDARRTAAIGAQGRVAGAAPAPSSNPVNQLGARAPASMADSLSAKRNRDQVAQPEAMSARRAMAKAESVGPARCFEVRQPAEAIPRVISLSAAALADSVRLAGFVVRGDTLASVSRGVIAVATRCPEQ